MGGRRRRGPRFRRRSPMFGSAVSSWSVAVCPPTPLDVAIGGRFGPVRAALGDGRDAARADPGAAERDAGGRGARSRRTSCRAASAELVVSDGPLTYFACRPGDRADQAPVARVPRRRARPGARTARRSASAPRSSSSASSGSSATRGTCVSRHAGRSTARWPASSASRC